MSILSASKVVKDYVQGDQPIHVLRGVDFKVERGETVAILGQSGSGKSTLLSLLAGLDKASSGDIVIAGQNITSFNEKQLAAFRAKHLGIIFQQFHLMSNLSALENVSLPLEIFHDDAAVKKAKAALAKVGLAERSGHFPSMLSGGERQRVAIARALVVEPSILLADEPSGNLDAETGEKTMQLLFELAETQKTTLILVTHNLDLARRCKRVVSLKAGQLHES